MSVPIGNHTKHDVTLSCKTALGSIELITRIVLTDELNLTNTSIVQEVNRDGPPETQQDKGGNVEQQWDVTKMIKKNVIRRVWSIHTMMIWDAYPEWKCPSPSGESGLLA